MRYPQAGSPANSVFEFRGDCHTVSVVAGPVYIPVGSTDDKLQALSTLPRAAVCLSVFFFFKKRVVREDILNPYLPLTG